MSAHSISSNMRKPQLVASYSPVVTIILRGTFFAALNSPNNHQEVELLQFISSCIRLLHASERTAYSRSKLIHQSYISQKSTPTRARISASKEIFSLNPTSPSKGQWCSVTCCRQTPSLWRGQHGRRSRR